MPNGIYEGPNEGFRGEVTRRAATVLRDYNTDGARLALVLTCPSCGSKWDRRQVSIEEHATNCIELRADAASEL